MMKVKKNKYTDDVIEFILKNYQGKDNVELAQLVNDEFNLHVDSDGISNFKSRYLKNTGVNLRTGINKGCFEKGNIPYNKGKKQIEYMSQETIERTKATRFKKGQVPQNYRPVGSERTTKDGYIQVKVADPNKWQLKHRFIYEKHYGEIPKGFNVMFADKNKRNFDVNNLILVSKSEDLIMNQNKLIYDDGDLTKTGHTIAKIINKTFELKKEGEHERGKN